MTGTEESPGLGYRTLRELFELTASDRINFRTSITASVLEVYNEDIRDLLQQDHSAGSRSKLEVRQTERGIWVPGLTELPVESARDVSKRSAVDGAVIVVSFIGISSFPTACIAVLRSHTFWKWQQVCVPAQQPT
jgi:hypothetical protein